MKAAVRGDGYYRRYPGDYLKDTLELSMLEDGAYNRLLDYYYSKKRLPSDPARLYSIARARGEEECKAVDKVVREYFRVDGDRLVQDRVEREMAARREYLDTQKWKSDLGVEVARKAREDKGKNPKAARGSTRTPPGGAAGDDQKDNPLADPKEDPRVDPEETRGSTRRITPASASASRSGSGSASAAEVQPLLSGAGPPDGADGGQIPYDEIMRHLNAAAGKCFNPRAEGARKHIRARWKEGARLPQFVAAIDHQVAEWKGTEFEKYLRPATLFNGEKFDGYVNNIRAPAAAEPKGWPGLREGMRRIREGERDGRDVREGDGDPAGGVPGAGSQAGGD